MEFASHLPRLPLVIMGRQGDFRPLGLRFFFLDDWTILPPLSILRVALSPQCSPGAAMLTTIANLHQHEVGTTSLLLFWQYIILAPVLTLYMMAFFWLYSARAPS